MADQKFKEFTVLALSWENTYEGGFLGSWIQIWSKNG